jgi:hypothetical protein
MSFGQGVHPDAIVTLTTDVIMNRVAANQNQSQELRKRYLRKEEIHIVTRKPGGKLMREEPADYEIVRWEQKLKSKSSRSRAGTGIQRKI